MADAALLSQKNIDALRENKYEYILGGRIKNETEEIKTKIIALDVQEGKPKKLKSKNGKLVVSFSSKRAHNDKKNREKGLKRLEKRVSSGKLSKELERLLRKNKIKISPEKAIDEIKEIRQLQCILPKSQQVKTRILQPTEKQSVLLNMKI
ncbi:hypothetical protein N9164_12350 [Draconibacterium sp.]|nr:hypothetical protein [Draconibacterium sp.]